MRCLLSGPKLIVSLPVPRRLNATHPAPRSQEILTEIPLGKHNREPVLRVQKMENAKKALDRIKEMGVQLTNIGPEGRLTFSREASGVA